MHKSRNGPNFFSIGGMHKSRNGPNFFSIGDHFGKLENYASMLHIDDGQLACAHALERPSSLAICWLDGRLGWDSQKRCWRGKVSTYMESHALPYLP